jgi:pyruvate/2-oxoglutarate dehydrogenase complex dihydrolipoamide dehydrogenase (E3) component
VDRFDAVIIGMGPGGEVCAGRLLDAGKRVAVVERELIGGECAYWACIPSKTLLRATEAQAEAERVAGMTRPALNWAQVSDFRDYMVRHHDDTAQVRSYERSGATVLKGIARLVGRGRVEVEGQQLEADHVVVATGSEALRPPVEGLDEVPVWTNREATNLRDIPARVLLVGGSAVGVELGQFFARMGSEVTVVQRGERLVDREEPRVGELAQHALEADGVTVHTGRIATSARRSGGVTVVTLDDGTEIRTDIVVLGAGRHPRTAGLGLASVGVRLDDNGAVLIDDHCRAAEGLWALGDVTGVALFTHVAMYQGRVVADNILGHERLASYDGIPRVVFADPEIAAVGLTAEQGRRRGIDLVTAEVELADAIARPWTYERDPRGTLGLLADRTRRVLVGAWAVAPLAGEWIHQAALAVRAQIPLKVLLDQVAQFPTYTESYLKGLESLATK